MHPGMGLRTMYEMLQPEGIGRDGFIALGIQEGYRLQSIERQTRTTFSVKTNRYCNLPGVRSSKAQMSCGAAILGSFIVWGSSFTLSLLWMCIAAALWVIM